MRHNGPTQHAQAALVLARALADLADEALGLPDEGIPPGTPFESLPMNWTCPDCKARKEDFELLTE
jgi:rubredoxin